MYTFTTNDQPQPQIHKGQVVTLDGNTYRVIASSANATTLTLKLEVIHES